MIARETASGALAASASSIASSRSASPLGSPMSPRAVPMVASASARTASRPSSAAIRSARTPVSMASVRLPASIWKRAAWPSARACAADGRTLANELQRPLEVRLDPGGIAGVPRDLREVRLGLGGRLHIAGRLERRRCLDKAIAGLGVRERGESAAEAVQQPALGLRRPRPRARADKTVLQPCMR